MKNITLIVLILGLFSILAKAQDADPAVDNLVISAPAPEVEEAEDKELPFEISGFVDVYYMYSFLDKFSPFKSTKGQKVPSPFPTSFTETINSFTLGMANISLSKEGKVGFMVDLAVGPRAEVANGFSGTTLSAIKQLYVTYTPKDWLTFTLGNFGTHVGYELIDAPANLNYSTSYMFSNGPFYHTGLKADIALSESFGLMVGIFDDTDSKFDITPGKHFGGQLSYIEGDLAVFFNYIGGKDVEGDSVTIESIGHQVDLTATYQVSEKFGLGLNTTSKTNALEEIDNTSWFGAALYANYTFSDAFTLALRGEYIGDPDGEILGLVDGDVLAMTLSGNINIGPLTVIPEFRIDMASDGIFLDSDGGLNETSPAIIVAAVYSF